MQLSQHAAAWEAPQRSTHLRHLGWAPARDGALGAEGRPPPGRGVSGRHGHDTRRARLAQIGTAGQAVATSPWVPIARGAPGPMACRPTRNAVISAYPGSPGNNMT